MPWSDGLVAGTAAYDVAASLNSRIRVVAGPGTGKSFAMKRRVARLLETGVDPAAILPVTFTRVAAEDLHRELVGMGVPGCDNLNGVTLHSLSLKILLRNHVLHATGRTARPLSRHYRMQVACWLATIDKETRCETTHPSFDESSFHQKAASH
jgi:DNA helicase-2/ATP-dependent DNA helicase PcrA